jgi:hypothetical protein
VLEEKDEVLYDFFLIVRYGYLEKLLRGMKMSTIYMVLSRLDRKQANIGTHKKLNGTHFRS